jgi:hypothetical protein
MTWQPAAIVYPDVEMLLAGDGHDGRPLGIIRAGLAGRLEPYAQGAYVSNTVPEQRRPRMVIVRRDGGNAENLRDSARVNVRVWSLREQDAVDLFRLVAALLWASPNGQPVLAVRQLSGPVATVDESGVPIKFGVFEIDARGEALL